MYEKAFQNAKSSLLQLITHPLEGDVVRYNNCVGPPGQHFSILGAVWVQDAIQQVNHKSQNHKNRQRI